MHGDGPAAGARRPQLLQHLAPEQGARLTTSKALPQGSTLGAQGRADHSASTLRGKALAEASQAAPSGVTLAVC